MTEDPASREPPLVVHVLYRFDTGGLENGVVNLINRMPPQRYRHAVVALTECVPEFAARLVSADVPLYSMHKPPGHGVKLVPAFYRLMRQLAPAIVHTRNLAALEMSAAAVLAGVPVRIHGEHGWDSADPDGSRRRFRWIRRAYSPAIDQYVALSGQLADYLTGRVGIASRRVSRICNGVDSERFRGGGGRCVGLPFAIDDPWIFGTVGRLQEVKDQLTLVRAFARLLDDSAEAARRACLVVVGDGPLRGAVEDEIDRHRLVGRVWLAGSRRDVPELMQGFDCFVLPSTNEGISNTILEAMASALPVIATAVGGNPELVVDGECGWLVPPADPAAMAAAMAQSLVAPQQSAQFGTAARARVEAQFSLDAMVNAYADLYDRVLGRKRPDA